jgi:hypothetical protein
MAEATLQGPAAVLGLGEKALFTWLGKIFYGLIHRELFLAFDRRDPAAGSIATPELIENYSLHHLFLQNIRVPMEFAGGFPASLFVYETLEPPDRRLRWDFRDNLPNLFISVRVGRTGLIGVLQDGGVQTGMKHLLEDFFQFPLHPVQHAELAAQVCYKSLLTAHVPKYVVMDNGLQDPVIVLQAPVGGLSGQVAFRDWNWRQYAVLLSHFVQAPVESLFDEATGRVMSWLRTADGSPNVFTPELVEQPPIAIQTPGSAAPRPTSARRRADRHH